MIFFTMHGDVNKEFFRSETASASHPTCFLCTHERIITVPLFPQTVCTHVHVSHSCLDSCMWLPFSSNCPKYGMFSLEDERRLCKILLFFPFDSLRFPFRFGPDSEQLCTQRQSQ